MGCIHVPPFLSVMLAETRLSLNWNRLQRATFRQLDFRTQVMVWLPIRALRQWLMVLIGHSARTRL
jgi:hypothetical protein